MKKKRYSILLNIITVCFCICTIAVGVYAAKSASITASVTVGFSVHNCSFNVRSKIYAVENSEQATDYSTTNALRTITNEYNAGNTTTFSHNLGNLYFSDLAQNGNSIIIIMDIENTSSFNIDVKMTEKGFVSTNTNISISVKKITAQEETELELNTNETLTTQNGEEYSGSDTLSLKITLTLNNNESSLQNSLNLGFSLAKSAPIETFSFNLYYYGYGGPGMVSEPSYTFEAERGMTFEEWINSKYCVGLLENFSFWIEETMAGWYVVVFGDIYDETYQFGLQYGNSPSITVLKTTEVLETDYYAGSGGSAS